MGGADSRSLAQVHCVFRFPETLLSVMYVLLRQEGLRLGMTRQTWGGHGNNVWHW